jgi:hypothetical protein
VRGFDGPNLDGGAGRELCRHANSGALCGCPEGDLPVIAGDGTSKSATSRWFVALSAERLAEWMASDLSKLDLFGHPDRRPAYW